MSSVPPPPTHPPEASLVSSAWREFRSAPRWVRGLAWLVLATWAVGALGAPGAEVESEPVPTTAEAASTWTPTHAPTPTSTPTSTATPTPTPTPTPSQPSLPEGVPEDVQPAVVERIVDGDTIWVRVDDPGGPLPAGAGHSVRLLGIDTPETVAPGQGVQCWGPETSAYAGERLAVGSTVYLQADNEDTDQYGRFLRYVWTEDGAFFNRQAVLEGHAQAVLYEPNDRHIDELRDAEAIAQSEERGLWGAPCDYDGAVVAEEPPFIPQPEPDPEAEPAQPLAPEPNPAGGCEPGYDPCIPSYPPDVDCGDLDGPYRVTGSDPHGLDGDNDGFGCE